MYKVIMLSCIAMVFSIQLLSQEKKVCDTPDDSLILDLNSITKCSVESKKGDNASVDQKVSVEISSRRRIVRERDEATGVLATSHEHELEGIKKKNSLITNLDLDKDKTLLFELVEEIPLFKKCQKVSFKEQKSCFKKEMTNHVRKYFRYPTEAYSQGIQGRVIAHFIIEKDGKIGDIRLNSPYKGQMLGAEVEKIIKRLPAFVPGKHSGRPVSVNYSVPINFSIKGVEPTNVRAFNKREKILDEVYNFKDLERIPLFKGCKASNDTSINCFNKNLIGYIESHFAYPKEAVSKNIEGLIYASFIINSKGNIVNLDAKGPDGTRVLENAAKQLVYKLPKFEAGIKNGKAVNSKYRFPISFKLN